MVVRIEGDKTFKNIDEAREAIIGHDEATVKPKKPRKKRITKEEQYLQLVKDAKKLVGKKSKIDVIEISVDKLSFVGDLRKIMLVKGIETVISNDPNFKYNGHKDGDPTFMFREKFHVTVGTANSQRMKNKIRVEFNPNKINKMDQGYLEQLLRLFVRDIRFTRIDIATDVKNKLNDYEYFMKKFKKKENTIRGTDSQIETMYFGTPNSELMYRIYDKNKEQKIENPEHDWWRLEVVFRRDKADNFQIINPFWNMIISQPDIDRIEDFQTRCIVERLIKKPDEWKHIDKNKKAFYKKIIENCSGETDLAPDFARVFEQKKADLMAQVNHYKELCSDWKSKLNNDTE